MANWIGDAGGGIPGSAKRLLKAAPAGAQPTPPPSSPEPAGPGFQAINAGWTTSGQHPHLSAAARRLHGAGFIPAVANRPAIRELQDRDFTVTAIHGWREHGDELQYLTVWSDNGVDPGLVNTNEHGRKFVRCDGRDWDVRASIADHPNDLSDMQLVVAWSPTWQPLHTLQNAAQAIDDFETDDPNVIKSQRQYMISEHLLPLGGPNADPERQYPGGDLPAMPIPSRDFQAVASIDYAMGLVSLILQGPQKSIFRQCEDIRIKRALRIRGGWSRPGRMLRLSRGEKLNAALIYVKGAIRPRPCRQCAVGRGPFLYCVVLTGAGKGV